MSIMNDKGAESQDLVEYSNMLRLKNMDLRARETKFIARIKQLEA